MGLFDTIILDRSLVEGLDSRIDSYLAVLGEDEVALQTKDFDCALATYRIENNKLYFDKVEREWRDGEGLFGGYLEEISREKQAHFVTRTIQDRKSTRLNSSHIPLSRMPSSA